MSRNKENDILETILSIAEKEYREAYYFYHEIGTRPHYTSLLPCGTEE